MNSTFLFSNTLQFSVFETVEVLISAITLNHLMSQYCDALRV
jgi:hypothetical protein